MEILGCTWEELKTHLENNPYGFKVGDEGLDIDHIRYISQANNHKELLELSHYSNLQLLPAEYNRKIKGASDFNRENFEAEFCEAI